MNIWNIDSQCHRQRDLMILFLHQNLPNLLRQSKLARARSERLALANTQATTADRFVLVIQVEPQHVFIFVGGL